MRLWIAIRAFFGVLVDGHVAERVRRALADEAATAIPKQETSPQQETSPGPPPPTALPPSARDSAVTLLAALQREARLVDLIQEDLGLYSDAQVGAAARPCLQQCAGVLSRLFELQPVVVAAEGDLVDVAENASPLRYQWVGEGTAASGKLVHHGWQATKVDLPKWTGEKADAQVIAPAQVQAP
jgi:hypothetical protein